MTTKTSDALMDARLWTGKIFNGEWIDAAGGDYPVVEPATGSQLGTLGRANPADVARAAVQAQVQHAL